MDNLPPLVDGIPVPPNDDSDDDDEDEEAMDQRLREEAYVRLLNRIGIDGASLLQYLYIRQGQTTIESLAVLNHAEILNIVTTTNKTPNTDPVARRGAGSLFVINAVSLKYLYCVREWIKWRRAMAMSFEADEFTDQWKHWSIERMDFEARNKIATSETTSLPEELKSTGYKTWIPFWRQFQNYCDTIRGTLNIPITYVFRESAMRGMNVFSAVYTTSDEALMSCVALHGTYYNEDNARVWGILESLTCNGNTYPFIKRFKSKKDGRGAILALKAQCEGSSATATRLAVAYNLKNKTTFDGKGSRYTFDSYVEKLQFAFSELEECGDPQSESHKIHTLCNQCTASTMTAGTEDVENHPQEYTTFGEASEFLKGYSARKLSKVQSSSQDRRNVSYTETEPDDYSGLKDHYDKSEWKKLSQATKTRVIQRNRKAKAKMSTSGTAPAQVTAKRRTVKKIKGQPDETTEPQESSSSSESESPSKRKVHFTKSDKNDDTQE